MSRKNTLAGQRFGNLVAMEATAGRKNGYTIWKCVCDCGRTAEIASRSLKNKWSTTCGDPACTFAAKEQKMRGRYKNLTGKSFGKLLVRGMLAERSSTGQVLWDCLCDCGNTVVAPTGQLKAGYRKSCGCLSSPPLKDWIGRKFGWLTVTAYDGKRGGKHFWKCSCDCGNETTVCQSNLKNGHTISCGCQNKFHEARTMVDGTCVEILRSAVEKKTLPSNNSSGVRGVIKANAPAAGAHRSLLKGKRSIWAVLKPFRKQEKPGNEAKRSLRSFWMNLIVFPITLPAKTENKRITRKGKKLCKRR